MLSIDQYFQALAPKIWDEADQKAAVQALYPVAAEFIPIQQWGNNRNQAIALYSLHMNAMASEGDTTVGSLTGAKTGEYSEKSWSVPKLNAEDGDLGLTRYGQQLLRLRTVQSGKYMFPQAPLCQ